MQPLRKSARKPVQPLARASMPSRVIWSHHDRFNISSILQPSLKQRSHKNQKKVWKSDNRKHYLLSRLTSTICITFLWVRPLMLKLGLRSINTSGPWGSGWWWRRRRWDLIVWAWSKTCWGWGWCCLWSWCSRSGSALRCFYSSEQMSWEAGEALISH